MIAKVLWVAVGGAAGTLARVGLSAFVQRLGGPRFPWGTVGVNLLGCFLFGLLWAVTERRADIAPQARMIVLTGFMGAFTTFSTFVFDCSELGHASRYVAALGNIFLQNAVGLGLLLAGLALGRAL